MKDLHPVVGDPGYEELLRRVEAFLPAKYQSEDKRVPRADPDSQVAQVLETARDACRAYAEYLRRFEPHATGDIHSLADAAEALASAVAFMEGP